MDNPIPDVPAPSIETALTRILGDGDCHATRPLRHRETRRMPSMRELFGVNPDGRLVPLFPLGVYAVRS